MAQTESKAGDPVRQFNVFIENKVGRLNELIGVLSSHGIHPMALTILDTTDSAIVRMVVDDPEGAREFLHEHGFHFTENLVVAAEVEDPVDLRPFLAALLEAEVNVHYLYAFGYRPGERRALVVSVDDVEIAQQCLGAHGFRVLGQGDISR